MSDFTAAEFRALIALYRAESDWHWQPIHSSEQHDALVLIWRSLVSRGLVTETDKPRGSAFSPTDAGRVVIEQQLETCGCWCHGDGSGAVECGAHWPGAECCIAAYALKRGSSRSSLCPFCLQSMPRLSDPACCEGMADVRAYSNKESKP
jgi:hypothetical protein